nr:hypothetical protein [Tanacetum cinerariifolium]
MLLGKLTTAGVNVVQVWTTTKSKIVNREVHIHALVDGIKVIIVESYVSIDLQLADEDGIDCLLNPTIFENLALIDKQLDGLPTYKEKYDVSFHNKKAFANMKRICKGFSGKETPLFPTMVGPNQLQMGEGSVQSIDTQHTPTFDMPLPKPKKTKKPRQPKRKTTKASRHHEDTSAHTRYERVSKTSSDLLLAEVNTPRSDKDRLKHTELMKIYTILQKKVLDLEDELKRTKTAQQTKIDSLERRVKKLEKKQRSRTHKLKGLYKVGLLPVTQDNIVQDEGIEDVGKEEVVKVVTTTKMSIDAVVDAAQVTTAIADILVSAAETIFTIAPTISAEPRKTNVEVTQAPKRN